MYNAYDVISIQTHTYKEITYSSNAPRLSTFSSKPPKEETKEIGEPPSAGKKSKKKAPKSKAPIVNPDGDAECSCPRVVSKGPRVSSKRDSLKARKNSSHVSIIKRNMEAGTKAKPKKEAREKREKIPKDPTYEEIDCDLDDNKNVMELAALIGERLDHALRKPTVSECCASAAKNTGKSSSSNKPQQAKLRAKKSTEVDDNGMDKVCGAMNVKENLVDCDCDCLDEGIRCDANADAAQDRGLQHQTKEKRHPHEFDSSRANGNIKTYIFGEQPMDESKNKKTALKERQCHLAVASPRSRGRGLRAKEELLCSPNTGCMTEKRSKRASSTSFLRASFKASARKYKDNVVHTYKRRLPKHDKRHDGYGNGGRQFVHQIPRIVISCENSAAENRMTKSKSLSRIRHSLRGKSAAPDPRCGNFQESGEESANEYCPRSRPHDASETFREENGSPEDRRGNSRSHSSTRSGRHVSYGSLERSKSVHAKRRTPRRDSPALSDDLYVRRKTHGLRNDLAKMR